MVKAVVSREMHPGLFIVRVSSSYFIARCACMRNEKRKATASVRSGGAAAALSFFPKKQILLFFTAELPNSDSTYDVARLFTSLSSTRIRRSDISNAEKVRHNPTILE